MEYSLKDTMQDTVQDTLKDTLSKSVYISTYGCQMNVNDTERMFSLLEMIHFKPVHQPEDADLIIINSCSVREKPVHKVFSEVGRYRQLKQKKPHLKIGVSGCVSQQEKGNLIRRQPLIDFVFGPDAIDLLPGIVADCFEKTLPHEKSSPASSSVSCPANSKKPQTDNRIFTRFEHGKPYHIETLVRNPGVATFVNITKGCDNFCTFCIVPYTRGRERSRPLKHLITDVQKLVSRGVKEVTLLGQNVNSYRSECGADFADLLRSLSTDTDIQRIRFTTSHPKDFGEKLMKVMATYQKKICEYIHLPVQSGNSSILKKMNRGYTAEEYLEKIQKIKEIIPHVVLSTDIIVGFPGETESQYRDTEEMILKVGYETLFAFKYSPRPFTKASRMPDPIPEDIKSQRLQRLLDLQRKISFEKALYYEGQTLEVLVENHDKKQGRLLGRSTQNKLVHFEGNDTSLIGKCCPVYIKQAFPNTMRGELAR